MSNVPDTLRYRESHEWIVPDTESASVGITDHAQHELTDVVFVDLPQVGRKVSAGDQVAVIESVKAASDIYAPVSGEITEVNEALNSEPALINTDPYGKGWLFKIKPNDQTEVAALMSPEAYKSHIG
jgi:glycine cleavage system H protein